MDSYPVRRANGVAAVSMPCPRTTNPIASFCQHCRIKKIARCSGLDSAARAADTPPFGQPSRRSQGPTHGRYRGDGLQAPTGRSLRVRAGFLLPLPRNLPRGQGRAIGEQGRGIACRLVHLRAGFSLDFILFVDEQNPSEALRGGSRTTFETPASWPGQSIGERRTAPTFPLCTSPS